MTCQNSPSKRPPSRGPFAFWCMEKPNTGVPTLLPLLDDIKPLVELVTMLDPFISPTGKLF